MGTNENGDILSKLVTGVKRLSNPHRVPLPRLVPLTCSNFPSLSILITEMPEPMLTSKHGSCGVGLVSKMTPYCSRFTLGHSNPSGPLLWPIKVTDIKGKAGGSGERVK